MDYAKLLNKAIGLAAQAHMGQYREDGQPYILHPLRVMMRADGYGDQIVAVSHDTLEDTPLTVDDLKRAGFPMDIIDAIVTLTKRPGEDYEAFIERVAQNPRATRVKLLDLLDNLDVGRLPTFGEKELARTAKYHRAVQRLTQALIESWSAKVS